MNETVFNRNDLDALRFLTTQHKQIRLVKKLLLEKHLNQARDYCIENDVYPDRNTLLRIATCIQKEAQ